MNRNLKTSVSERNQEELERLASFPENNPNPIVETDSSGEIYYINPAAKKIFPDLKKLKNKHPYLSNLDSVFDYFKKNPKKECLREMQIGDDWFQQQIYYIPKNQHMRIYGRYITQHMRYLAQTTKITQLYSVVSKVNEAIIRAKDEQSLFNEVCKIVSEIGGFPLVWVGKIAGLDVWPVAYYGPASNYLKEIKIGLEGKLSKGPTGTCIRKNKEIINDDFDTNPSTLPWRKSALKYNFRASAAFPLCLLNKPMGALALYTSEPKSFDPEKIKLLRALSADISYALDSLHLEQLRNNAEEKLRESEKILKKTQEIAHVGTWAYDNIRNKTYWSDETFRIYGYKPQEVAPSSKNFNAVVHPDDRKQVADIHYNSAEAGKSDYVDTFRIIKKSTGELRTIYEKCEFIRDKSGKVIRSIGMVQDITELRKSETELRKLLQAVEQSPVSIIITDSKGLIEYVNQGFIDTTGYSRKEAMGEKPIPLQPQMINNNTYNELVETITSGREWNGEVRNKKKNGDLYWEQASVSPVKNEEGEITNFLAVKTDITQQKNTEKELQTTLNRYRLITEATGQFDWACDHLGNPIGDSPALRKYAGLSIEDIKEDGGIRAIHPDDLPIVRAKWKEAISRKSLYEAEYRLRKYDNTYQYFLSRGVPLIEKDGSIKEWVGLCIDISERKNLEQRKDDFITIAGHELRTPISAIKIISQMLKDLLIDNPKALKYLQRIENQASIQANLVDDLLDVSKIQTGKFEIRKEKVDLQNLVKETVENIRKSETTHKIIIKGIIRKPILTDGERIRQILVNFCSNAIKFSPNGKKVIINLKERKKEIVICVTDFGIGIPKKYQHRIFERFYRAYGSGDKTYPGLGMGLYISHQIIELLGGKVWFKSFEGKGSTFYFSVPLA